MAKTLLQKITNFESETALLAHVLRHPDEYPSLADKVKAADFGWIAFGWVWAAMERLMTAGLVIDAVSLGDDLERAGQINEFCLPGEQLDNTRKVIKFSGRAALGQLREQETTTGAGDSYALIVQDYARKRDIVKTANQMATWAFNGRTSAAIIADVENTFGKMILHSAKIVSHTMDMPLAVARAMDATDKASTGERAMKTGLIDLDKFLGIQKTELVVVAARTGQGKTGFLCTVLLNAARAGKRGLLFSIEMGGVQITQRLISQLSGISAFRIMAGDIHDDEQDVYRNATEELSGLPITICDLPAIRIGQIRSEARKHEADFVMADYIQLANADKKQDRRDQDIGETTRGLKALAKELDIPVIAAAQLNRQSESRSDKRPQLGDLRESGDIENDSDSVVFIYRPDQYGNAESKRATEFIVAKHRNGPVGIANSIFLEEIIRFVDADIHNVDLNSRLDIDN